MVNYYETLKVSPKASNAEIKSAYRRLARKIHPDISGGSKKNTQAFAALAEAYEILGDPKRRASYDQKVLEAQFRGSENGSSVFTSSNPHAKRWRQMAYEKRYNEIIDRMMADERRESLAFQKIIFPTVALFLSILFVGLFKPVFFTNAGILGKIILISLFLVGVIHLAGRIREGFENFTYHEGDLHDSILDENERQIKPYSRLTATSFLVIGVCASLGIGLLIGHYLEFFIASLPNLFSTTLKPEFLIYPPIVVFFVDLMHKFASRFEP